MAKTLFKYLNHQTDENQAQLAKISDNTRAHISSRPVNLEYQKFSNYTLGVHESSRYSPPRKCLHLYSMYMFLHNFLVCFLSSSAVDLIHSKITTKFSTTYLFLCPVVLTHLPNRHVLRLSLMLLWPTKPVRYTLR